MGFLRKKILITFITLYITINNEWLKYLLKWEKWEFLILFSHEISKYSHIMEYFDKKRKENTKKFRKLLRAAFLYKFT